MIDNIPVCSMWHTYGSSLIWFDWKNRKYYPRSSRPRTRKEIMFFYWQQKIFFQKKIKDKNTFLKGGRNCNTKWITSRRPKGQTQTHTTVIYCTVLKFLLIRNKGIPSNGIAYPITLLTPQTCLQKTLACSPFKSSKTWQK